jgi:hypothetical protein
MSETAWQSQTKWLSDKTYYSDVPGGIWREKASKRDLRPRVTDRDVDKAKRKLTPQGVRSAAALVIVERLMRQMPASVSDRIAPRDKWQAVEELAAGRGQAGLALLCPA